MNEKELSGLIEEALGYLLRFARGLSKNPKDPCVGYLVRLASILYKFQDIAPGLEILGADKCSVLVCDIFIELYNPDSYGPFTGCALSLLGAFCYLDRFSASYALAPLNAHLRNFFTTFKRDDPDKYKELSEKFPIIQRIGTS